MAILKRLFWIFGAYVFTLLILVLGFVSLTLLDTDISDSIPWAFVFITSAIIVSTQLVFVLPIVKPPQLTVRGKSLLFSTCMASLIAALLSLGVITFVYSIIMTLAKQLPKDDQIIPAFFWITLASSWVFWSVIMLVYVFRKKRDPSVLVRMTSWLFAGSIVEFLLSIPLAILVARRSSCYCQTGSFFTLAFSFFSSLWLFGPFMVILFIWKKRPWTKDHCYNCGYPRKAINNAICSECGTAMQTK